MTDDGRHSGDQDDPQGGGAATSHGSEEPTGRVERAGSTPSEQPTQADPQSPGEPTTGPVPTTPTRGRIRQQDESTAPREPTLAERRARERKLESDRTAVLAKEARSKKNKRILIGTGATVGVVALIAAVYAASSSDDEVEARCVDENNVVVDDSNCQQPVAGSNHYGGGFFPIFLGGFGRQYHYNYGGSGGLGQVATGGTTTVPRDGTSVRSGTSGRSGTVSSGGTISRGGLGVSSGGSKGSSGSSSGSSGSSGSSSGS